MKIIYVIPTMDDIADIMSFLQEYINTGIILLRNEDEIAESINNYYIAKIDNKIIACSFLQIHNKTICEVRSLLVDEHYRQQGIAKNLIFHLIDMAKAMLLQEIIVLTYIKEVFTSMGFEEQNKKKIPNEKIWKDCLRCKFFHKCEEILLIKKL